LDCRSALFKRFCLSREDQDEHRSDQLSWRDSACAHNFA